MVLCLENTRLAELKSNFMGLAISNCTFPENNHTLPLGRSLEIPKEWGSFTEKIVSNVPFVTLL